MSRKKGNQQPRDNGLFSPYIQQQSLYIQEWRDFCYNVVMSRYEWEGLPDTVDERFLERTLMMEGQAVFFEYFGNLMATRVYCQGPRDVYDNFTKFRSIGGSNWDYDIPEGEGVMVYDSLARFNSFLTLENAAAELAEIDELTRVNRRQQRAMTVFSGPEGAQEDLKQLIRSMATSEQFMVTYKDLSDSGQKIEAIQTGIKYLQADFHEDRTATMNKFYQKFGIEHIGFEKKAHILESEAEIGNDNVNRIREAGLVPRQKAADAVNEMYGYNITVKWREDKVELEAPDEGEV